MKIHQLIKDGFGTEYALKLIDKYNPYGEYFLFSRGKDVRIVRNIGDKLYAIPLLSNHPDCSFEIKNFKELAETWKVIELPYFGGAMCDYTDKIKDKKRECKKEIFQKITDLI